MGNKRKVQKYSGRTRAKRAAGRKGARKQENDAVAEVSSSEASDVEVNETVLVIRMNH